MVENLVKAKAVVGEAAANVPVPEVNAMWMDGRSSTCGNVDPASRECNYVTERASLDSDGDCPTSGTASEADRAILLDLYNQTNGAQWHDNSNWNSDTAVCLWHGVCCNDQGNIEELMLSGNNIVGPLPTTLGGLASLRNLDLSFNLLSGTLPPEITSLSTLEGLKLDHNHLRGLLPVIALPAAQKILLGSNGFTGPLPTTLFNSSDLRMFEVVENLISGSIPPSIDRLTHLEVLRLESNSFSGSIPMELGQCNRLTELRLSFNLLTGTLPTVLGGLSRLAVLSVASNHLTGSLDVLDSLTAGIEKLFLQNNSFSGHVPSLTQLRCIYMFDVSNNALAGQLPDLSHTLISNAGMLMAGHNQLTGNFPAWLQNMTCILLVSLSHNSLRGPLPPWLGQLEYLHMLNVAGNQLTGALPASIQKLASLKQLLLYDNPGCISP